MQIRNSYNYTGFLQTVFDHRLEIRQILPVSDNVVRLVYSEMKDFVQENSTSNIVVSLVTTSMARLRLLNYMQQVENAGDCSLLYTDTDSVVFKHPKNMCPLPEGEFLGEMSREYADFHLDRFVAAGPKQWGLEMTHRKTGEKKWILKLRGITLDYGMDIFFIITLFQLSLTFKFVLFINL